MTLACLSAEDRDVIIEVNGKKAAVVNGNSGSYNTVTTVNVPVNLRKGVNRVRLYNPDYFMPDIDYFDLRRKSH